MIKPQQGLKRRSACDRCRSQKLRCLRHPGEKICTRCLTAQSQCVFGASRRGLRPHTVREDEAQLNQWDSNVISTSVEAYISNNTYAELASDLPIETLENDILSGFNDFTTNQPWLNIPGHNTPLFYDAPTTDQSATIHGVPNCYHRDMNEAMVGGKCTPNFYTAPAVLTRKLADLSVSIADHAITVPPLSIHESQLPTLITQPTNPNVSNHGNIQPCALDSTLVGQDKTSASAFALEDTFRLTQNLVDICSRVIEWLSADQRNQLQRKSDNVSIESTSPLAISLSGSSVIDHGLILLLLSCYHRLIDIWEAVFGHVKVLAELPGVPQCQKVQIGSFVPTSSSTSNSLQVALITELTMHLQDYIFRLRDILSASGPPSSHGYEAEAEEVNCKQMHTFRARRLERHNESSKTVTETVLTRLEDMLQKARFLKSEVERKRDEAVKV